MTTNKIHEHEMDLREASRIRKMVAERRAEANELEAKAEQLEAPIELTIAEYRAEIDTEIERRRATSNASTMTLRGLHNKLEGVVVVPGAKHGDLVRTAECFDGRCMDHGWL